jgi:hypothetical protein
MDNTYSVFVYSLSKPKAVDIYFIILTSSIAIISSNHAIVNDNVLNAAHIFSPGQPTLSTN